MEVRENTNAVNTENKNNKPQRTLMDEWKERQYGAYVNFLRKQGEGVYEEWRKFKAGKRQDENKLMLDFLIKKEKERKAN